jgi:hypothetical protein
MSCQLVVTGWFSTKEPRDYKTFGDDSIRGPGFRGLWWQSLQTYVKPEHVYLVDSASPVKPQDDAFAHGDLRTVELLVNPGHAQNTTHHYCGFMAGMIMGLEYALYSGADYMLYVEQDALVYGDKIIPSLEKALMKHGIVYGGKPGELVEQSFVAFDRKIIRKFLSRLHAIDVSDRFIEPEFKFMYAATSLNFLPFMLLLNRARPEWLRHPFAQIARRLFYSFREYETLPFGYGRIRPINFDDDHFYFQHGSVEELQAYKKKTGFA